MKTFLIALVAITLTAAGCAQKTDDKTPVLARFDGATITEKDLQRKLDTLPSELRGTALKRKKELIEDIAAEHYLMKEAEKKKLESDPEVRDLLQAARRKIIIAKLVESEIDSKVSLSPEEALKQALAAAGGNKARASEALQMSYSAFMARARDYGIG